MHVQTCCRILGQMPIPGRLTQSLFQVAEDLYVLESEIELHIPLSAGQGRFVVLLILQCRSISPSWWPVLHPPRAEMKPGLWEQTPYAFVLLPRLLNMIRPTEIEVFSSPLLSQIHSINEICKSLTVYISRKL